MTPALEEARRIRVGSRICADDGHFGTVLYIGEVRGTKGEWLGVEWDSDTRGKHDGEHEGVRYFSTEQGRGSFLRPKKVLPSSGFLKELTARYGLQATPNAGVSTEQLYVGDGTGRVTVVEMVGAEKVNKQQSDFRSLEIVVLREARIHGLEAGIDLTKIIPNIVELNLSKNLFDSWNQIAEIAIHLRRLKTLIVSENRLQLPRSTEELADAFRSVKVLFMNRMNVDFATVLKLSGLCEDLQELHVCFNGIKKLSGPGRCLTNLKLLNLEGNCLDSWNEIMNLQHLPNLDTLIVNDTGLKTVDLRNLDQQGFPSLTNISMRNNEVADWPSIVQLNRLKLTDLKLNGNPLCSSQKWDSVRETMVGIIRTLERLNRSIITPIERRGAEIVYLKNFGPEWLAAGGNQDPEKNHPNQEFLKLHPRFQELVEIYGAPELSEMYKAPQGLKDNLIEIFIKGPERTVTKRVPFTMSVQKLKTLVQRVLKADISTLTLTNVGQKGKEDEEGRFELDNDLRDLSYFSIVSGDVIEAIWH